MHFYRKAFVPRWLLLVLTSWVGAVSTLHPVRLKPPNGRLLCVLAMVPEALVYHINFGSQPVVGVPPLA